MNVDTEQKLGVLIPDGKHILSQVKEELNTRGFHPSRQRRNGHLLIEVNDLPVNFIGQSSRDIPRLVDQGIYPLGIVGSDRVADYLASASLADHTPNIEELARLQVFNPNVRVSILVRNDSRYAEVEDLEDQRVITSYPGLASQFFTFTEVPIQLDGLANGKEEVQVYDRKAEAAVVIVDSGGTMRRWKLRELNTVLLDIQPVLIGNLELLKKGSQYLIDQFEQFMETFQNGDRSNRSLPSLSEPVLLDPSITGIPSPAA